MPDQVRDSFGIMLSAGIAMADYAQARRVMVDRQVRTADVTDLRIISALLEVPREMFVPAARQARRFRAVPQATR